MTATSQPRGVDHLRDLPDLALRSFGGSVVSANDELFAERENLIRPEPPVFTPRTFGSKGQVYDGWETRRRREPGHDWAIVRLGAPGVVRAVVVDTRHFTGNAPTEVWVEGAAVTGYLSVPELQAQRWHALVPRSPVAADTENVFAVTLPQRCTHVRLAIHPDGGVARLRVHGEVVADPALLEVLGTVDLAALQNGGRVVDCSNRFYGSADRLVAPGLARSMGEGWETARRRDDGNDWVVVRLAARGVVTVAELDTTWFLGNAPGWAALSSCDGDGAAGAPWTPLLPRTRLQPDTPHRFVVDGAAPATYVRLDVYPDGGMARLRLWGRPSDDGLAALRRRWHDTQETAPTGTTPTGTAHRAIVATRRAERDQRRRAGCGQAGRPWRGGAHPGGAGVRRGAGPPLPRPPRRAARAAPSAPRAGA
jgi:allantoicase